jgi:outer membrane protein assembly factor BamB
MRHVQPRRRSALALTAASGVAALLVIAACSKDKEIDQPAKLTPLASPSLHLQHLWGAAVGDRHEPVLRLGLGAAIADGRVYAAGHHGDVMAFDLTTGHRVWRTYAKAPLAGGTAAGGGLVVVGSSDGQFFAFDAENGHARWKVRLNGEVLAPAAISDKLIAVRTVDGRLHALSPEDGRELWTQEQQVPRLSLRGTARPAIVGDVVLCGFDNGKVLAVNAGDGSVQWETTVTPPHGRTELERLDDIDSPITISGHDVYAVGFQGKVAMLALDTGQIWWSHEASSYRGLTLDGDTLYVADADGELAALKARTGAVLWRQNALLHRGLSPPTILEDSVVVADFQGYVHFIDKASGALAARVSSGHVRVSTPPLVAGNILVIINDRGEINAWRVTPIAGAVATAHKPLPETPAPAAEPAPENK